MLMELLAKAASIATLVFVISSMLAMGMGLTVSQIIAPLRNARLVILALVANFVLMPLGAFALGKLLRLDQPLGVGLLVLGCAAGAPFLPKLAQLSKGNLPFGVGMMVLLMVITVGYLPLVLPLLLPGVTVDPVKIAQSLVLLMLLPMGIGLIVKRRFEGVAARVKPLLDWLSNIALISLVVLISAANFEHILQVFGTRGILAGLLFIALGFCVGWLLGGPGSDTRRVLSLGTAQRNIAAGFVVGGQSFQDPRVIVMVTVVAIVGLLTLMPLARALAKRGAEQSAHAGVGSNPPTEKPS
jgi:BASS family bile acid:Na+ symporter